MRMLQAVARQPLGVMIGFVGASALFLVVFGLALASGRVLATHGGSGNVHACVNQYTGQARIMLPARPPNCTSSEILVEWAGTGVTVDVAMLQAEVAALQAQVPDCLSTEGVDAVFEGCNVHVRNGLAGTETTNGSGNLIVGYNENLETFARGGSHNIVVGPNHGYTSYAGIVAGNQNRISDDFASVTGGEFNIASGAASSVSGGQNNVANGRVSSVSGGASNEATEAGASVSGGFMNTASGNSASILGGRFNTASNASSTVSGGQNNAADGDGSSVSGGNGRTAPGADDWVAGALGQGF